ncbi:hypothetical protein GCM10009069_05060 [Algimonas arctica]|uniref:Uncharacterized protein n=1 Tax=Algimonas arctica TaxID=1479486 RepID=A0A8J3G1C0_9PROT|nr:hypothetical protein GCM10009069_05060 [Algimonas arctica]
MSIKLGAHQFAHSGSGKFRLIIWTDMLRRAILCEQICENSQDIIMLELSLDMDG